MKNKEKSYELVPIVHHATEIVIQNPAQQTIAEEALKNIARLKKEITAHYDSLINPIQEALDTKKAEKNEHIEKLNLATIKIKEKLTSYLDQQLQAETAKAEALTAKSMVIAKKDQDKQIKQLIKAGKTEEALELSQTVLPTVVYHPIVPSTGEGISQAKHLEIKIIDETSIPLKYFKPRELNMKLIRSDLHKGIKIQGIESFYVNSVRISA